MFNKLSEYLQSIWYDRNKHPPKILIALAYIWRLIVWLRIKLYKLGLFKTSSFQVPVIIVGNLTVGGNGKTPLVQALCRYLQLHGFSPGIVSRGYGRKTKGVRSVRAEDSYLDVGDEAKLLWQQLQVPVVVGEKRTAAVEKLLSENPTCDVIISDDGLSHYALGRYIELVVVDNKRQFGNGYCLPAGPLREPISRLKTVTSCVYKGILSEDKIGVQLVPKQFYNLQNKQTVSIQDFNGKEVYAIAGIGNPESFFQSLERLGVTVFKHPLPDHGVLPISELQAINGIIVMTEKDAIKYQDQSLPDNIWVLEIKPIISASLSEQILELLLRSDYGFSVTRNPCLSSVQGQIKF